MIDWSSTYGIAYRLHRVDERTWLEAGEVGGFRSAHVELSDEGAMCGASLEIGLPAGEPLDAGYYRLSAEVEQGGSSGLFHLGTFHCLSQAGSVDRGLDALSVKGRSVLFPAQAKRLDRGANAPAGCDGVDFAASLLEATLRAPVSASGSFTLDDGYAFDVGSPVLDGVWRVLAAGGWCVQVDGRGGVSVAPLPSEPAVELDEAGASLVLPGVSHEADLAAAYNTYTAIDGAVQVKAVNDDPASPTSTVSLGFDNDAPFDASPARVDGETLAGYAARKLAEARTVREWRTYRREYQPGVLPFSLARGTLASVGLDGDLRVSRQAFDCGRGRRLVVTERAYKEVLS